MQYQTAIVTTRPFSLPCKHLQGSENGRVVMIVPDWQYCAKNPNNHPPHRVCARVRIGTRFLRPRGTSPLKGVNTTGTPGYRNGTKSFFGLKGRPSVMRDV
jgi:hypothetical protein